MSTLKRNTQLEQNFRIFKRLLCDFNGLTKDIDQAFYIVMGDYTGQDSLLDQINYIVDIFLMDTREIEFLLKDLKLEQRYESLWDTRENDSELREILSVLSVYLPNKRMGA